MFSLDYRVAPEDRWPAAADDVERAFEWLIGGGLPPERLAIAGDSAGGALVLNLLIALRNTGRPQPACAVVFSPLADLGPSLPFERDDTSDPVFLSRNAHEFAAVYLDGHPGDDPAVSPIRNSLHGLAPVLIEVGSTEMLLADAKQLHEAMRAAGTPTELRIYDRVPHCWQLSAPMLPEAVLSLRNAARFINNHLDRRHDA